uniref:Photosynthesis system II assembly factor Ycf48/Hcf136-like domain-containing protein n=1 Tax=Candidatus Kentrum sp. LPFa TaxID=2126335 RepID=A0A450WIX9_9GAMM|nr:MAG: Uncharacterized protein BECKLPF1236A_GA0070988_101593 [Candidatus Kentron sp. LPFa]
MDARSDPPYADTFFICWGDEILNMIVRIFTFPIPDSGFIPLSLLVALLITLPACDVAREGSAQNTPLRMGISVPANPSHAWRAPLATRSLLLAIEQSGHRIIAVGERGHILYRQERIPWRQAQVPTQVLLTGLSFSHARHGLAVGHDGIILATDDGGQTWRKVREAIEEERPLLDILSWDRFGIAVGAYGYLLETKDGGQSWRPGAIREDHDFHLNAIAMTPDAITGAITENSRIYIAAEAGYAYRSDDLGDTWQTLDPPYDGSFFGIHPIDGKKVIVFGLRSHLFASEDAGETWRPVNTGIQATLTSATSLRDGRILVTGHGGNLLLVDRALRRTRHAQLPERKDLSAAVEIAPNRILLAGEGGIRAIDLRQVFSDAP